jgi:hypothetical protein
MVLDERSLVGKLMGEGMYSDVLHPPHFKTELLPVTTVE